MGRQAHMCEPDVEKFVLVCLSFKIKIKKKEKKRPEKGIEPATFSL
jgi:hypothetical protein